MVTQAMLLRPMVTGYLTVDFTLRFLYAENPSIFVVAMIALSLALVKVTLFMPDSINRETKSNEDKKESNEND
jgi:mannose/fructose/N-acetylgalactosamine-specific phosphotransferase system component IIC